MQYLKRIYKFSRQISQKIRKRPQRAGLILAGTLAAVLLILQIQTISPDITVNRPVNLISSQDWFHMAGAEEISGGLSIKPLGRAIVNQNGSDNQINTPVNVRGPHLFFDGGLELSFMAAGLPAKGTASFSLYSTPPIIYDEWRYEPPQLKIELSKTKIAVYIWDGAGDTPAYSQSWDRTPSDKAFVSITADKKSRTFDLNADGIVLGSIDSGDLFNDGHLWFGADSSGDSQGWILKSLSVTASKGKLEILKGPNLAVSDKNPQGLRRLATANPRNLPIGAAVASYPLFSDPGYRKLVGSQFNLLVPENELKAQFTHPQAGIYDFTEADNLVDFAAANDMAVHGHNLVFSEANPKWMQTAPVNQRQQIMTDHITTEIKHFGSKIASWDVVDEPLDDNNGLRRNIWSDAMGEGYIGKAFITARAANPDAKLYLNEYGLEADGPRWDAFLSLLQRLRSQGVPLDGIGFQAHVHDQADEVSAQTLIKHLKVLADMGLLARISEADVYGDSQSKQSEQYGDILQACLGSPNCTAFTTWGVTDRYGSTTELHNYPPQPGNDLIWDASLKPKATYRNLQTILSKR